MRKDAAIILIGVKHCGKSTLGRALAQKQNVPFVDVDDVILKITGKSPREIYLKGGPQGFMDAESKACKVIAEKFNGKETVIATGGGICDNPEAMIQLSSLGRFVMINSSLKVVMDRVFSKVSQKPDGSWSGLPAYVAVKNPSNVQQAQEIFKKVMSERIENYTRIADVVFEPVKDTVENNAVRLLNLLK